MDVYKISCRTCSQCGKLFSAISNLRRHERNVHNVDLSFRRKATYRCVRCGMTYNKRVHLKGHQYSVHKMLQVAYTVEYPCFICSKTFETSCALKRHKEHDHFGSADQINEVIFECNECGETYIKKSNLRRHLRERHFSDVLNYKLLQNVLPEFHENVNVIKYSVVNEYQNQFTAKFTISLKDKNAADRWLADFQRKNKVTLKKESIHRTVKHNVLYLVKLGCHHNTRPRAGVKSRKNTNCEAYIQIKLFGFADETKNYAEVKLLHTHNHELSSSDFLRFRKPVEEVRRKFRAMFLNGVTPAQALRQHMKDLEQQYGTEFRSAIGDRGICPTLSWAYNYKLSCLKDPNKDHCIRMEQPSTKAFPKWIDYSKNANAFEEHTREEKIPLPNSNESSDSRPRDVDSFCGYGVKIEQTCNLKYDSSIKDRDSLKSLDAVSESGNLAVCLGTLESVQPGASDSKSNLSVFKETSLTTGFSTNNKITILKGNVIIQNLTLPESSLENAVECVEALPDFAVLDDFDRMNQSIKSMVYMYPYLLKGLQHMVSHLSKNLEDPTQLSEALFAFGKR